ncbi:MAG: hypothetical protein LBV50_12650 [Novosphingobium sp.]|jgi:hypothetical protein|nr:hypothetical protein [Novosphingobium sp.]
MNTATIVAVVGVAAALVLAIRAVRAHAMSFERMATMAVVWILIIMTLAWILQRYAP